MIFFIVCDDECGAIVRCIGARKSGLSWYLTKAILQSS
jgi:hypothetical protein